MPGLKHNIFRFVRRLAKSPAKIAAEDASKALATATRRRKPSPLRFRHVKIGARSAAQRIKALRLRAAARSGEGDRLKLRP